MKKSLLPTAMAVCALSLIGPLAHADPASQARQQIQADYDSQNAAMGRKDGPGALAHVDHAFVGSGPMSKPESYQQRVQAQTQMFAQAQTIHITTHIQKFALHGANADVQIADRAAVTIADPKTGKAVKLTFLYTVADKWVKRPTGWMLLSSRQLAMKMLP